MSMNYRNGRDLMTSASPENASRTRMLQTQLLSAWSIHEACIFSTKAVIFIVGFLQVARYFAIITLSDGSSRVIHISVHYGDLTFDGE